MTSNPEKPSSSEDLPENEKRNRRRQFSLASLVLLTLAFGISFALVNWIGGYGFCIGCLLVWAAIGRIAGKLNWQLGGSVSAAIITLVLALSWLDSGTIGGVVGDDLLRRQWGLEGIEKLVQRYEEVNGVYPDRLEDLWGLTGIPDISPLAIENDSRGTQLVRQGDTYQIIFLGRDEKPGGVGLDSDCPVESLDEYGQRRIPMDQFLFDQQGNPRIKMLSIFGLIVGLSISQSFAKVRDKRSGSDEKNNWRLVAGLLVFSVISVVAGVMMAGLHLMLGQSSGH